MPTTAKRKVTTDKRRPKPKRRTPQVKDKRASLFDDPKLAASWMKHMYGNPLPFEICHSGCLANSELESGFDVAQYEWCGAQAAVAETALKAGFSLSVKVPRAAIAHAASAIARSLTCDTCMGYDSHNELLVVWSIRDDDESDTREDETN